MRIVALFRSGIVRYPADETKRIELTSVFAPLSDYHERLHSDSHVTRYAFQLDASCEREKCHNRVCFQVTTRMFCIRAREIPFRDYIQKTSQKARPLFISVGYMSVTFLSNKLTRKILSFSALNLGSLL